MKLSVVIPAYNEEGSLAETIGGISTVLEKHKIEHELFVVDDNSSDGTSDVLESLSRQYPVLKYETNSGPNGFGYAVRFGLERFSGDCVAVMMADLSDSPEDLAKFYFTMVEGNYDCVFGSRFIKGGQLIDYPFNKKILNRTANFIIRVVMGIKYNDTTNAFKLYRRETIEGIRPLLSPHFNLTIELPLKAVIRGYTYHIVPNSWINRKHGKSKFKIREMGSRYFYILLYCFIEKYFTRGDFKKKW